jgi:hypothetical protein
VGTRRERLVLLLEDRSRDRGSRVSGDTLSIRGV